MKPFLNQVAEYLLSNHKSNLYDYWLVFPNKRTGLFFKQKLSELCSDPIFVPSILSIDEFVNYFSELQEIDHLGALIQLFRTHQQITKSDESFDDFYFWGEMLLNDFDDLDKYLIDAEKIYSNLLNLKEIDQIFWEDTDDEYLNKETIKGFWSTLLSLDKRGTKEFLKTWEFLYPVYKSFNESLKKENLAYKGMIYKDALEKLHLLNPAHYPFKNVGFVGFNALTRAEEQIFGVMQAQHKVEFFWDYTETMLTDNANKAGFFLKKYTQMFPGVLKATIPNNTKPNITVTAVPSSAAQTNIAGQILNDGKDHGVETAIVLANENLLQTMLNKVPDSISSLNITMGFPLKNSQVSALVSALIGIQQRISYSKGQAAFHFKSVGNLLSNSIIQHLSPTVESKQLMLVQERLFNVPLSFFDDDPILSALFTPVEQGQDVVPYLKHVFELLLLALNEDEEEPLESAQPDIEKELIYSVYVQMNRASDLLKNNMVNLPGRDLMFRLMKRIIDGITLPFQGEPLKGIQLMGILETRNLDFENLIILSANEGFLPASVPGNSFIPFNLRKGYGLPTVEEHDAMYAYYFYRLIYRAKAVNLLYDSTSQGMNSGEPSRFIYQLEYLSNLNINNQNVSYNISLSQMRKVCIEKDASVMKALDAFVTGSSSISASNLNSYLDCKLKFYLAYVEKIKEPDKINEDVDARIFGNAFHEIMDLLYRDFEGKEVQKEDMQKLINSKGHINDTVMYAFAKNFFDQEKPDITRIKGKLLIYVNVLLKYVYRLLEYDMAYAPFNYVEGEQKISDQCIDVTNKKGIKLIAFIDRIDRKNDELRIVDYKSGNIDVNTQQQIIMKDIEGLFDREKALSSDQKAIFQTLFYSMLYHKSKVSKQSITPAIMPIRKLFNSRVFNPEILHADKNIVRYQNVAEEYETLLENTLNELFDPSIPFSQASDIKTCTYCDFKNICGR